MAYIDRHTQLAGKYFPDLQSSHQDTLVLRYTTTLARLNNIKLVQKSFINTAVAGNQSKSPEMEM